MDVKLSCRGSRSRKAGKRRALGSTSQTRHCSPLDSALSSEQCHAGLCRTLLCSHTVCAGYRVGESPMRAPLCSLPPACFFIFIYLFWRDGLWIAGEMGYWLCFVITVTRFCKAERNRPRVVRGAVGKRKWMAKWLFFRHERC